MNNKVHAGHTKVHVVKDVMPDTELVVVAMDTNDMLGMSSVHFGVHKNARLVLSARNAMKFFPRRGMILEHVCRLRNTVVLIVV